MAHTPHQRAKAKAATHTHAPGDRLFDPRTAQEGILQRSTFHRTLAAPAARSAAAAAPGSLNLPIPKTTERLTIQLEDGSTVTRTPEEVIPIPAGLVDLAAWGG